MWLLVISIWVVKIKRLLGLMLRSMCLWLWTIRAKLPWLKKCLCITLECKQRWQLKKRIYWRSEGSTMLGRSWLMRWIRRWTEWSRLKRLLWWGGIWLQVNKCSGMKSLVLKMKSKWLITCTRTLICSWRKNQLLSGLVSVTRTKPKSNMFQQLNNTLKND